MTSLSTALEGVQYSTASLELPEMRHFLYKSRTSAQFTSPQYSPAYSVPENKARLDSVYLAIQNRFLSASQPLKLCHLASCQEVTLGWLTQSFELYAAFSPTCSNCDVDNTLHKKFKSSPVPPPWPSSCQASLSQQH